MEKVRSNVGIEVSLISRRTGKTNIRMIDRALYKDEMGRLYIRYNGVWRCDLIKLKSTEPELEYMIKIQKD